MFNSSADRRPRLLALGDSYTIGEGVDAALRWPAQLAAGLRAQLIELDSVEIVASTGWTTDELQQAIDARDFMPPYALVSLLIGVNNQYRGRDLDNYASELAALLDFAVRMADDDARKVIVVSIPDWGTTQFAVAGQVDATRVALEIDGFNAIARRTCEARGAHWVDVTAISRDQAREMLADDGLHPSADQYTLWVDAILPVALSILDVGD